MLTKVAKGTAFRCDFNNSVLVIFSSLCMYVMYTCQYYDYTKDVHNLILCLSFKTLNDINYNGLQSISVKFKLIQKLCSHTKYFHDTYTTGLLQ